MAVPSIVPATNETSLHHHHKLRAAASLSAMARHPRDHVEVAVLAATTKKRRRTDNMIRTDPGPGQGPGQDQGQGQGPGQGQGQDQDRGRTQIPAQYHDPDHALEPPHHAAHHADIALPPPTTTSPSPSAPTSAPISSFAATRKPSPKSASLQTAGG